MFAAESEFFKHSKVVTRKFLQTTVIIDDQAFFGPTDTPNTSDTKSITPPPSSLRNAPLPDSRSDSSAEASPTPDPMLSHRLDAQQVINSFAMRQIVCSVIKPTSNINLTELVSNIAVSTDIIIVDWDLNGDKGKKALDIIKHVADTASERPEQLRLVAIYTGEPEISTIIDGLKGKLGETVTTEGDGFSLKFHSIRITVLVKPFTKLPPEQENRKVSFEDLPERVISEFTVMTAGLVSNVAVEAMTCIRENTFRLLKRFSPELDAPFITHKLLQVDPEDTESHLTALLAEEIRAILEEKKIGSEAGVKAISNWLDAKGIQEITPFPGKTISKAHLLALAEHGINSDSLPESFGKKNKEKLFKSLTAALINAPTNNNLDEKFAILTNMRSFYEKSDRMLTLGSIIELKSLPNEAEVPPKYYLCLQPVCDTVRLSEERSFPFIPLDLPIGNDPKFSIVVFEESNGQARFLRLLPKTKPYHLELIEFAPQGEHDRIVSVQIDNEYTFQDTSGNIYTWIGELRDEHALRNIHNISSTMSRVGLNESEWLRLFSRSQKDE